jgi:hypothetical protein
MEAIEAGMEVNSAQGNLSCISFNKSILESCSRCYPYGGLLHDEGMDVSKLYTSRVNISLVEPSFEDHKCHRW